jgi:tetratricopeptide (TPR) repeat protein
LLAIFGLTIFSSCNKSNDETKAYELYQNKKFENAQKIFQEILKKDSSAKAYYNLGSNLLANHQIDTAISFFDQSLQKKPDTLLAAQALFNKACALFKKSDFQKSAESFKSVLRYTPGDYRAQYNLSLALAHIPPQDQDQQKDQDKKDQDKKDNKDHDKDQDQKNKDDQKNKSDDQKDQDKKDQDEKNKEDQKDKSDQKDQNKKDQEKEDNKNSENTPQKGKLSPQDVQRLYQALDQQEKAVQKRIMTQQKGDESNQRFIEKDW